jgi:hypothetical protein
MRFAWVFVAGMATSAWGQDPPKPTNLFQTVRPQVLITIRRDPNGSVADLVEARTIDPKYPAEQLQAQLIELGRLMNSEPRGLLVGRASITGADASMTTIKASCAIDNIIDRKSPKFHLAEIAKAFSGFADPNKVTGITLFLVGEKPGKDTLLAFGNEASPVQVQGALDPSLGLEYRIKLNTQEAEDIVIPEGAEQKSPAAPSTDANRGIDWTIWGLIILAGCALGALVYSLLVRSTSSKRSAG